MASAQCAYNLRHAQVVGTCVAAPCLLLIVMASNKEAIVMVLDVGPSGKESAGGSSFLDNSVKCMTMILQRKIFSESKDEVGLVLCGTFETKNPLATGTEYRNIVLARELGPVNWPFMEMIEKEVGKSSVTGDLVDALVVAMDHLVTRTRGAKFAGRQIYFLSDLRSELSVDQLETIVKGLKREDIQLTVIGPDLERPRPDFDPSKSKSSCTGDGESLFRKMLDDVGGSSFAFDEVVPALSFFKRKTVRPVAWKVSLEVGSSLHIPVCVYLKVKKPQMKAWKKAYAKETSMKILSEQSYHKNDDMQEAIEKSETIKAYRYGRTLVPFSDEDRANMEYRSGGKVFEVLGFTKQSDVKRHHFIGDCTYFVVADKSFDSAGIALSALIRALHETDFVAIVRHVYSIKSDPKLGILAPRIKANYECLVFIQVPFAEDLRTYTFPALDSNPENVPTEKQLDVLDELIDSMDLANTKTGEVLRPRSILNPHVQRLYQCLLHRELKPKAPLPDIESELLKTFSPDKTISAAGEVIGNKLKHLFPLEKVASKKDKTTATSFFQKITDDKEPLAKHRKLTADDLEDIGVAAFVRMDVTEVRTVDPTSDFIEIVRSNPNEFANAFKQMTKVILQLVMDSFGELLTQENHKKALSCLKVLRKESIANSSDSFNSFLRELRDSLLAKGKQPFWNQMRDSEIGLITKEEAPSSVCTASDVLAFFTIEETKDEEASEALDEDEDDLLNMM